MIKSEILDVTRIEPRLKHATIFEHFDALSGGEGFIISNDHDPRPLYYQLLGERGQTFSWEYLESGPERWQIKISKSGEKEETVGEIAARDIRKAETFKKLGIDFCCGGKKTVSEAIAEVGVSRAQLDAEFAKIETGPLAGGAVHRYDTWDPGFLADYIQQVHHRYVRENGPVLEGLAEKVANRHGAEHPELLEMVQTVKKLTADLYSHLQKEEEVLFPLIKQLERESGAKMQLDAPIQRMEAEHEDAGDELRTLRQLSRDYSLPASACNSYRYLFQKLEEFEADLFQHIHLENNILFPKAIELEKSNPAVN